MSPLVEYAVAEADERETKRLRSGSKSSTEVALMNEDYETFAYLAAECAGFLEEKAETSYLQHEEAYQSRGV